MKVAVVSQTCSRHMKHLYLSSCPTILMSRVSFSPTRECVEADRVFLTPNGTGNAVVVIALFNVYLCEDATTP